MLLAILRAGGDTRVYTYGHADRRNVSGVETYRRISARERGDCPRGCERTVRNPGESIIGLTQDFYCQMMRGPE